MKKPHNLYAILGVSPDAKAVEIRLAFRHLAIALHPDHHPGDAVKEARFKEVAAAYEVLGDPEKRRVYDEKLAEANRNADAAAARAAKEALARQAAEAARRAAENAQRTAPAAQSPSGGPSWDPGRYPRLHPQARFRGARFWEGSLRLPGSSSR
jgi:DnaJ-class molecular chaperone